MGFYVTLAFKNLKRHGRRTLITALAIALGLAGYLFMNSMLEGADRESERNLIWYETGAIRVYSPQGGKDWDRLSLKAPVVRTSAVLAALKDAGYTAVPRVSFQAELVLSDPRYNTPTSKVIRAIGMASQDGAVFPQKELKVDGRWFRPGEEGIVVGKWLADDLGIKVGYPVSLSARTRAGSYQVVDLEVTGIVDSPNPNVNRGTVFLPLDLVDTQWEMKGEATEIVVGHDITTDMGADTRSAGVKIAALLSQKGLETAVLNWQDLAGDYLAVSQAKQKSSGMIMLLVFIIAAVGISNTLLMAFYERKTEIGMLRALGMDEGTLFWTFILEAANIGLIGACLGLILGGLAVAWLVYVGIDFSTFVRKMDIGYRISGVFHGVWIPSSFVGALILGVLLSAFTAIFPTRRALKLPITESLRTE